MKLIKESDTLRANKLLKKMSPMEKIGQLHQVWGIDLIPGVPKPDDMVRQGLVGSMLYVMDVKPCPTDEETAILGIEAMEDFFRSIHMPTNLKELGVTPDMYEGIADGTFLLEGGYKKLTRGEVIEILKESM